MNPSTPAVTPLRQRMIDDMRMRKLEHKTQEAYIRAVCKLAAFLRRSPDTATVEDLRRFQLHLVDRGTSPITLNATLTGLKFFFEVTLDRGELMAKMQPVRVPHTLPVVLSREEVARLIAAAPNLKSQTALSVAYGAGLRASEVIALKVGDIDSQRMTLRVEQGKGRKDRYAMLSPVLLERLRVWWRAGHAQGRILPGGWLFPGVNPIDPLTTRQLNRAIPCRRRGSADCQARVDAQLAPQLRYPPAGAEGRYPPDPSPARTQEARDHLDVCPRSHRDPARGGEPPGEPAAHVGEPPWGAPPRRSPTSSVSMGPLGARGSART
jgi:integrase/recombinase XerD